MSKVNKVRHLRYWWEHESIIDPTNANSEYFVVTYDQKGRIVRIVKHNKDNIILDYDCLSWKGSWLIKVEKYSPDNILQYKVTFHYNRLGFLINKKYITMNGSVTSSLKGQEEDLIDILGEWLLRLLQLPVIEARGLVNYMKEQAGH